MATLSGPMPYGYRRSLGGIETTRREAEIIQLIFALLDAGTSLTEIARRLNETGAKTHEGAMFAPATIHQMRKRHLDKYNGGPIRQWPGRCWPRILGVDLDREPESEPEPAKPSKPLKNRYSRRKRSVRL